MSFTRGNVRKVSNYGRWECVITSPTGNVGKSYGDTKSEVEANGALFAEAPAMVEALRSCTDRLAGFPDYLNKNGSPVLASIVEEALAQQRAILARIDA